MNTVQPIRDVKDIDHMKRVLKDIHPKYEMLFALGINTGLRVSDLLALRVSDIKGKDHVTINEQKTGKRKRFLINKPLQKELNKYTKMSGLKDDDLLFPGNSKPPKEEGKKSKAGQISRIQIYRVLNDAAQKCGLDEIGTHTMRKTFGFHFYKRTHDVAMLMDIFNHSAPSITLRYIGITDSQKDEALEHFYL